MQSKTFSRISFVIPLIVTIGVLIYIAKQAASTVPLPEFPELATSTPVAAPSVQKLSMLPIKTPLGTIQAFLASTSAEREQGLSGQQSLPDDGGMLFSFDQPAKYGFWMKDMLIPIDIIWILPDKSVSGILRDVAPGTYPQVFYSSVPVRYVLELNSGGAAKWGIATGTKLVF
jgi:uncharacterized protein